MAARRQRRRPPTTASGTHRAAAGGQGDRHLLRLRWRRQDDHRRGRGGHGRRPPRRQGARAHRRPGQAAGQRARARAVRQHRDPRARRGVRRRRRRPAGRAVGGDARHEAVVGRPGAPPRPRRQHPRRHPRQPAVPEHHRQVRAEPRLHRHGAAVRDPHGGHLRPDRRRHAADPQRDRLPRSARAHGRLLQQPAPALAHRAVPVAGS